MYDISNLEIGDKFYMVSDIYEFVELKVIDINVCYFKIAKRNLLRFVNSFLAEDMKSDWIKVDIRKEYFATFDEAEHAYLENISRKKEVISNQETLLKNLYELAFKDSESLEADLYKKHINTILYTYKKFDY